MAAFALDRPALLGVFDREHRIEIEYPDMKKEAWPHLVRFSRPAPGTNFIVYFDPAGQDVDQVIQEQIAYFSKFNQPFHWKVYVHDHPADMIDRLVYRGFRTQARDTVMVLDLSAAPAGLLDPVQLDLRTINVREDLAEVIQVLESVYGGDFRWVFYRLGSHLEIPDYLTVYTAYTANRPVSTGWIYFHKGSQFASLWGGSTTENHRGAGFYSAILAARVQLARERGYRYLLVDAGPMSRPIVAKYGFRLLTCTTTCEWVRSP